jgi:hypothetical protein
LQAFFCKYILKMEHEYNKKEGVIFPQNVMILDPNAKNYSNCDIEGSFYTVEKINTDKKQEQATGVVFKSK